MDHTTRCSGPHLIHAGSHKTLRHGIAVEELPIFCHPRLGGRTSSVCLMTDLDAKRERLLELMGSLESCVVAFSAGVDSTVVAKAAQLALGDRAVAVTGTSASLAEGELAEARRLAGRIGIRHEVISTDELDNPLYRQNAADRCFHCKTELYTHLAQYAGRWGLRVLVNGANADDAGDYRPGMEAARQYAVRSPLAECDLGKQQVRELAALWDLPVWNKPAAPCLSSRVAYGQEVTPERLAMIDRAEQYLRSHGLQAVRVRYHQGDLARIEVPLETVPQVCRADVRGGLVEHFQKLGFKFVTLDLEGFRSGSLNTLLPIEALTKY